jgi:F0F1-type ATP synthase assembly protein I
MPRNDRKAKAVMKARDAVYYGGLMVGIIVGTLTLRMLGVSGILQLVGGLVVGVGLGYLAERAYGVEQSCPNPHCGWKGSRRRGQYCPRCGEPLSGGDD